MKTILVPTDFSETADNAVDYAIEISKNMNAKIVLLHVFCIPPFHMEIHLLRRNSDSIEKKCMEHLTEIERRIRVQAGPAIEIECVCQRGNVLDTITNYARLQAVNLVVMGMQGSTNLVEKLIGNTTESLLRACPCPVLAIGRHVKFKPPGKILLASDYIESENKAKMVLLKDLVSTFKSQLHVLNIIQNDLLTR